MIDGHLESRIKIWSKVAISAWQNNAGGGYRAWRMAHHIDRDGSGRVYKRDLYDFISNLGVHPETRRRWVNQALDLGIFSEAIDDHGVIYYLSSLANAAIVFGCRKIGKPASVVASDLVNRGWRSVVWAAYNTNINGPMSQEKKEVETGVPARTQREYLSNVEVEKNKNYARRDLPADPDHLRGYEEVTGRKVLINEQGQVRQKLPDYINVPPEIATREPMGRSKKAQREINTTLSNVGQGNDGNTPLRLFHDTAKDISNTERHIPAAIPGETIPESLFLKECTQQNFTLWDTVPLEEIGCGFAI